MKNTFSLITITIISTSLFGQLESANKHKPLKISSSLIIDNIYNVDGGIKSGYSTLGLFDFSVDYTPVANGFLKNTSFYAHLLKTGGHGASEKLIGDVQVASNIEGRVSRFVYEFYIKQTVKNFSFSLGLHDLNTEFMASELAGEYINSSFGIFPAVSLNVPVSIFPVTSIGGIASYNTKSFDIVTGFYNLNHDYIEEDEFNINNHLYEKGFLGVLELRYRLYITNGLTGEYKIGGYYKDCHHNEGKDEYDECSKEKNHGAYFIADQMICALPKNYSIGIFAQTGIAPSESNYVPDYYGAGISLKTLNKKLFPEFIGLAIGSVGLNDFNEHNELMNTTRETAIELSIKKELFGRITLQPDIQYIMNPSGIYSNALLGILRLQIDFNN